MIADDTHISGHRLWPWVEEPYKLWSLLDMLNDTPLGLVFYLSQKLEWAKHRLMTESLPGGSWLQVQPEVLEALKIVEKAVDGLPLPRSFRGSFKRLKEAAEEKSFPVILLDRLHEFQACLNDELDGVYSLYIRPELSQYYKSASETIGQEAFEVLPDSGREDLKAACRCFAVEEWTAFVFHLMRAVGFALVQWGTDLGLVLGVPMIEAEWHQIIAAAEKERKRLQDLPRTDRSGTWQEDVESIGQRIVYFQGFKDAWRNFVSHGRTTYDERRATEILEAVRSFLRQFRAAP